MMRRVSHLATARNPELSRQTARSTGPRPDGLQRRRTVIENDAHQIRERCGSIRGTADSGRVRGNEMLERKSLALPVWRHPSEGFAFDSNSQSSLVRLKR